MRENKEEVSKQERSKRVITVQHGVNLVRKDSPVAPQYSVVTVLPIAESSKTGSKVVFRRRSRRNTTILVPFSRRRRENGTNNKAS